MVLKHMASGAYYINLLIWPLKLLLLLCHSHTLLLKSNIRELAVVEQSKCRLIY